MRCSRRRVTASLRPPNPSTGSSSCFLSHSHSRQTLCPTQEKDDHISAWPQWAPNQEALSQNDIAPRKHWRRRAPRPEFSTHSNQCKTLRAYPFGSRGQHYQPVEKVIWPCSGAFASMVRSQNSSESPDSLTFCCLPWERNPSLPDANHFFNTLLCDESVPSTKSLWFRSCHPTAIAPSLGPD